jgi:hypothetical protein
MRPGRTVLRTAVIPPAASTEPRNDPQRSRHQRSRAARGESRGAHLRDAGEAWRLREPVRTGLIQTSTSPSPITVGGIGAGRSRGRARSSATSWWGTTSSARRPSRSTATSCPSRWPPAGTGSAGGFSGGVSWLCQNHIAHAEGRCIRRGAPRPVDALRTDSPRMICRTPHGRSALRTGPSAGGRRAAPGRATRRPQAVRGAATAARGWGPRPRRAAVRGAATATRGALRAAVRRGARRAELRPDRLR